ncbi:helix-turn-helix domain-containing protein [Aquipuribacter sp. MA13-6]|uniref:helix-turn-helix domain-containing protein n=1 Tax=unclassified Aquipuribacter TaxID=2635084 RepID=UPI003EE938C1
MLFVMDGDAGVVLRARRPQLSALRRERGWSQSRLLYAVRERAESRGMTLASAASLKVALSRWENGHQIPDGTHRRLLADALGVPAADLGFDDPAPQPFVPKRVVGPDLVAYYEAAFRLHVTADQVVGPADVRPVVMAQVKALEQARRSASGETAQRLLKASARYLELAGWLAQDTGDLGLAERLTARAGDQANALGDEDFATYVTVRRAAIVGEANRAQDALDLAQLAHRRAAGLPGATRALAGRQVALAAAQSADTAATSRAIDQALAAVREPMPADHPGHYCSPSYVHMEAAQALRVLGRSADAVEHLVTALDAWPHHQERDQALCLARLADTHACLDAVDEACTAATSSIAIHAVAPSARTARTLRRVRNRLSAHRRDPSVQPVLLSLSAVG